MAESSSSAQYQRLSTLRETPPLRRYGSMEDCASLKGKGLGGQGEGSRSQEPRQGVDASDDAWRSKPEASMSPTGSTASELPPGPADEGDPHQGVTKMQLMLRYGRKRGKRTLLHTLPWRWGWLPLVYLFLYIVSILTSLDGNTTPTVEPYFISKMKAHSMLSTIAVIVNLMYALGKPPLAKYLDVFGRAEGIMLSGFLYCLGYLMICMSPNIGVFIAGKAVSTLGNQGVQFSQQLIIADTTSLANRGFITATITLPWVLTVVVGPAWGQWFEEKGEMGYRSVYAVFGCLVPITTFCLGYILRREWAFVQRKLDKRRKRRAQKRAMFTTAPSSLSKLANRLEIDEDDRFSRVSDPRCRTPSVASRTLLRTQRSISVIASEAELVNEFNVRTVVSFRDYMDIIGLAALTLSCGLILLPLSLESSSHAPLMMIAGAVLFVFFVHYELHVAPHPILSLALIRTKNVAISAFLGFVVFCSLFCFESYFTSFLQVARHYSPAHASYIAQSYVFSATLSSVAAGIGAKYTRRYKWLAVLGVAILISGTVLMIRARAEEVSDVLNAQGSAMTLDLMLSQIVMGAGGGLLSLVGPLGCQSVVSKQDIGMAMALLLMMTQIGGACGGALSGFIWTSTLPKELASNLPEMENKAEVVQNIVDSISVALSYPPGTPIRKAIDAAYTTTQKKLSLVAVALMAVPALILALLLQDIPLTDDDDDDMSDDGNTTSTTEPDDYSSDDAL